MGFKYNAVVLRGTERLDGFTVDCEMSRVDGKGWKWKISWPCMFDLLSGFKMGMQPNREQAEVIAGVALVSLKEEYYYAKQRLKPIGKVPND